MDEWGGRGLAAAAVTSCGLRLGSRPNAASGKDHWEPGTVVALWYTEEGPAGLLRPLPGRAGHGEPDDLRPGRFGRVRPGNC